MKESNAIYSMTVEDIQTVAQDTLERKLMPDEVERVIPQIERRMPWYDVIQESIHDVINE